jgi:hypothetical protein
MPRHATGLYQKWGCIVTNQSTLTPACFGEISGTARGIEFPVCRQALRSVPEEASARLQQSSTLVHAYGPPGRSQVFAYAAHRDHGFHHIVNADSTGT